MLHVERIGEGKPVLVLHGLLADYRQMLPLLPALSNCEAFFVDLPGHGQSSKEPSKTLIADTVHELKELCKKHKIEHVIAYSISGSIALRLQLPNTIFIATFCTNPLGQGPLKVFLGKEMKIQAILEKNKSRFEQLLRDVFTKDIGIPGLGKASVDCALLYLEAATSDNTALAAKLKRVLVISGTKDKLIDYHLGKALAKAANAMFVTVPEMHLPILKNPQVLQNIKAFLSDDFQVQRE